MKKTTLRMIAEQVGIAHVGILNYFNGKMEIAAKTIGDYITGLQKKCGELIDEMPPKTLDEEEGFQTTWWLLHFKLLFDNASFRKLCVLFNKEGPLVLPRPFIPARLKILTGPVSPIPAWRRLSPEACWRPSTSIW